MDSIEKIKKFISLSPQRTIFSTPEWLEAVAPGKWRYIVLESNETIRCCMPIVSYKKFGMNILKMPPLTQSLGALLTNKEGKYSENLSSDFNDMSKLISEIPNVSFFNQRFHPSISNWLPFYWEGYKQTTRYTYIISNLENLGSIWLGMRSNIRREIRKAEKSLKIEQSKDFKLLKYFISSTYKRQQINSFPFKVLKRVFDLCNQNGNGKVLLAKNEKGDYYGAVYLIWDEKSAYYLAGGSPEHLRRSGAMSLLLWEAIKFAAGVTKEFNFEGSMIKPIERFFRAFGGEQVPYLEIYKINSIFIQSLKYLFKG